MLLALVSISALIADATASGSPPISRCAAGKKKCLGKYVATVLGCHARAVQKGAEVDGACAAKATAKITGGGKGCFDKLEAKVPNDCLTLGDADDRLTEASAFVLDVVDDLSPGYPAPTTSVCSSKRMKCVGKKVAWWMKCSVKENKDGTVDVPCF